MLRPLILILVLSGLLGLGFVAATPMGGAPDEGAHLRYIQVLVGEHRLPRLDLEHRRANRHADAEYEGHQPPLYYSLAVPFYVLGRAVGGNAGGGYAVRALSILLGALGTWLVWLLARAAAPGRPGLWIAATAFAAFLPMRLAVNAAVGNDPLAEVTASARFCCCWRAELGGGGGCGRRRGPGWRWASRYSPRGTGYYCFPRGFLACTSPVNQERLQRRSPLRLDLRF